MFALVLAGSILIFIGIVMLVAAVIGYEYYRQRRVIIPTWVWAVMALGLLTSIAGGLLLVFGLKGYKEGYGVRTVSDVPVELPVNYTTVPINVDAVHTLHADGTSTGYIPNATGPVVMHDADGSGVIHTIHADGSHTVSS